MPPKRAKKQTKDKDASDSDSELERVNNVVDLTASDSEYEDKPKKKAKTQFKTETKPKPTFSIKAEPKAKTKTITSKSTAASKSSKPAARTVQAKPQRREDKKGGGKPKSILKNDTNMITVDFRQEAADALDATVESMQDAMDALDAEAASRSDRIAAILDAIVVASDPKDEERLEKAFEVRQIQQGLADLASVFSVQTYETAHEPSAKATVYFTKTRGDMIAAAERDIHVELENKQKELKRAAEANGSARELIRGMRGVLRAASGANGRVERESTRGYTSSRSCSCDSSS